VIVQGESFSRDWLNSETVASVASDTAFNSLFPGASILGSTAGGVLYSSLIREYFGVKGESLGYPMSGLVESEIERLLSCQIPESGYSLSSILTLPSSSEFLDDSVFIDAVDSANSDIDANSILDYMERELGLHDSWEIDPSADAVLIVHHALLFEDRSSLTYVTDLPTQRGISFWMLVPTDSSASEIFAAGESVELPPSVSTAFRTLFLPESWPSRSYEPIATCSIKSYMDLEIAASLNEESNLDDLENFMKKYDIDYERDRGRQRLSGIYDPEVDPNSTDGPVRVILFYNNNRQRTFDRAVVQRL